MSTICNSMEWSTVGSLILSLLLEGGLGSQIGNIMVQWVFPPVLAASAIWACWIGWQMAKAKDEGERKQAKDRFFKALATVFIIAALFLIMVGVNAAIG